MYGGVRGAPYRGNSVGPSTRLYAVFISVDRICHSLIESNNCPPKPSSTIF